MNVAGIVVIVIIVGWTLVSILVALAFGGMANGRDAPTSDLVEPTGSVDADAIASDLRIARRRTTPPVGDDGYRTAV